MADRYNGKLRNVLGQEINPGTEETLQSIKRDIGTLASNYATRLDTISTAGVTYVGKSTTGTATSSPSWQIMKMDETGTPVTLITTWADGNDLFDNVWDNRTSLTYL